MFTEIHGNGMLLFINNIEYKFMIQSIFGPSVSRFFGATPACSNKQAGMPDKISFKKEEAASARNSLRHSWTIRRNSGDWTIAVGPHLQVAPQNSRFIQLLELSLKRTKDSRSVLAEIYGSRLTNEIFNAYGLPTDRALDKKELEIFLIVAAARVTCEDLRTLQDCLLNNRAGNTALSILLDESEYEELNKLASKEFDSLNNTQIHTLVNFFRNERINSVASDRLSPEFHRIDLSDSRIGELKGALKATHHQKAFIKDLELLNRIQSWNSFVQEKDSDLTNTEMFGRYFAYCHLPNGVLLPSPHSTNSSFPVYYQVIGGIDQQGFACFFLSGIAKEFANTIKLLARGTVTSNSDSIIANLGNSSGKTAYKANRNEFLKLFKDITSKIQKSNLKIEIHGHSMGGALTQHILSSISGEIVRNLKNNILEPWANISFLDIKNWNSPAVSKIQDKKFADNLEYISLHPATSQIIFNLDYMRVSYDIIQKFGEVFLGLFRKSNNVNVRVIYYPSPSYFPIIGQHMQPVLTNSKNPIQPNLVLVDERKAEYELDKKIESLSHLISLNEGKEPSEEEKKLMDAYARHFPDWIEHIKTLSPSQLKETLEALTLISKKQNKKLLKNAQKINRYLNNTAYEYLPSRIQYAFTPVIRWIKNLIRLALTAEFPLRTKKKIEARTKAFFATQN